MPTHGYVSRWNQVDYPAEAERFLNTALLMPGPGGDAFSARAGRRVNGTGLAVSVSGSPEQVTVTPGAGVIYDQILSAAGPYTFEVPASVTRSLAARPATGLSRIDLVVARIYDADVNAGTGRDLVIEVISGQPAGTPDPPQLPTLSLELARLTVPGSGSITVTQSTARTVAAGGILPVTTTAERDALLPYRGLVVDNAQTGQLERWTGSVWRTVLSDEDTDWTALTIRSGYIAANVPLFGAPAVRRIGKQVFARGAIQRDTAETTPFTALSVLTIATVAAGFRPSVRHDFQAAGHSAATTSKILVNGLNTVSDPAPGDLQIVTGPVGPNYIALSGAPWLLG